MLPRYLCTIFGGCRYVSWPKYQKRPPLCARATSVPHPTGQRRHLSDIGEDVDTPESSSIFEPLPLAPRVARSAARVRSETAPFVDCCRVNVTAGNGGDGCVSLARVFANARAGADGGDGGAGGHVLFRASIRCRSLGEVKSVARAACGQPGRQQQCTGASANHMIIDVPVGTVVETSDGKHSASLDCDGEVFVAARGGSGGRGNNFFVTDTDQTPRYAERGAKGENFAYVLEMRTMADVGLIGFPNAGKSTLLKQISSARPRIANYPFTTLRPHVGTVDYSDGRQLAVADIPGLIAGAHKNRGLGVAFLRHVHRCSCLLYVLDACDQPVEQLRVLQHELEMYEKELSLRPAAFVVNKMDAPNAHHGLRCMKEELPNETIVPISAKTGTNIFELLQYVRRLCDQMTVEKSATIASGND